MHTIGIIGGSGIYDMPDLTQVREVRLRTPFGQPSDVFVVGNLGKVKLIFLPRHGRGHHLLPGEINGRANIWGMKKLGAQKIISFSAVGSMRESIAPGHMVIVDQFIDRSCRPSPTFFGEGVVAHVPLADPVCQELSKIVCESAVAAKATVHDRGTYLCIAGPQFSTRAESQLYRSWGVDVIGMTCPPEIRLAREAGLCYTTVALSTDYDCWHSSQEDVTVEAILAVMRQNIEAARETIRQAAQRLAYTSTCKCAEALRNAIMTAPEQIPAKTRRQLDLLIGPYLPLASASAARKTSPKRTKKPSKKVSMKTPAA